jgi:hypothetical protein
MTTMPAECIRRAWLTLGALTMPLEDRAAQYYCTELNLGYPSVRENVSNRPDQSGVDDRTAFFGDRLISANITAQGESVDAVAASFAPFMVPSVRPVLHYVLDRPGAPERSFTVRASGYSWPVTGSQRRDIQLQWVAADPIAADPTLHTATAWAGSEIGGGRFYDLVHNRAYGPEGGSLPTVAVLTSPGDVIVWPLLRIYGPITLPLVTFSYDAPTPPASVVFVAPFSIDAGRYVEVDTDAKTAYRDGDRAQPVLGSIDWLATVWPYIPARGAPATMSLRGESTTGTSQVQAAWQDGYLT